MAAPDQVNEAVVASILADVRAAAAGAPDQSIRKIASRHYVSTRRVRTIARDHGLADAWSTRAEHTAAATQARAAEMAARRLDLADRFLEEAEELLDRLHGPYTVFSFGGKENTYSEHIAAMPPSGDVRNLMQSAALAFDKHLAAVKHDTQDGTDTAVSLVGQLADGLQRAYEAMTADDQAEVVPPDPEHPER